MHPFCNLADDEEEDFSDKEEESIGELKSYTLVNVFTF